MVTDRDIEAVSLIKSEQWRQFIESTAAALQINIIFLVLDSREYISVCPKCMLCGYEITPFDFSLIESESDDIDIFIIKDSYAVIAREYRCSCSDSVPFNEKVNIAKELLINFMNILTEQWNGVSMISELATLHQINRIVLSMLRGDNKALDHVLDLILSATIILYDAEGSWLEYNYGGKINFLKKGVFPILSDIPKTDYSSITAEFKNPIIQGVIGTVGPLCRDRAQKFLDFMAQECSIIFEIDNLLSLMETKLSIILEKIDNLILLVDRKLNICYANRAASNMLAMPITDLLGYPVARIKAPWNDCVLTDTHTVTRGVRDEMLIGDSEYLTDWEVFPVEGDNTAGWIVMARDCTAFYRAQDMGNKLEEMVRNAKLVNVLAHDIKNPLAVLKGTINLIMAKNDTPEIHKYMNIGLEEISKISVLIDNLMTLEKIPAMSKEPVDLVKFLTDSLTILKSGFGGPNLTFKIELSPVSPIYADRRQLSTVITNLVKNACEAIGEEGIITLSLKQVDKNKVEFIVSDNGTGIPDSAFNDLFKPYFSTKEKGTGLGLTIVSSIVQSHGGSVTAYNNRDKGASFVVTLPVYNENLAEKEYEVLIICNDNTISLPIERILEDENLSCCSIAKIDQVFDAIYRMKPSVLILDENIINLNILNTIHSVCPNIYKIILGRRYYLEDASFTYLHKPVSYPKLLNSVKLYINKNRMQGNYSAKTY